MILRLDKEAEMGTTVASVSCFGEKNSKLYVYGVVSYSEIEEVVGYINKFLEEQNVIITVSIAKMLNLGDIVLLRKGGRIVGTAPDFEFIFPAD